MSKMETKFSNIVLSTDSSTKTETATTNSNNVHGSIVTEILLAKNRPIQWEKTLSLTMQGKLYGIHVPPRHFMERSIVSKMQRLPALPSSNFGLEILISKDETINIKDFFKHIPEI
ncbi:hypothetical protein C2G38_2225021 [Gigaspora rosea]|uniref:Uncharacterized protein n=1 Tax=Gigaspora rosea TaxID=44941 RepID=A0A397TZJ9_9GLOM|nr:hypothetical protein C2G38_2225021 [Gigaspora rosea]